MLAYAELGRTSQSQTVLKNMTQQYIYFGYIFGKTREKQGNDEYKIQGSSYLVWKGGGYIWGTLMVLSIVLYLKQGSMYTSACYLLLFVYIFSHFNVSEIRMVLQLLRVKWQLWCSCLYLRNILTNFFNLCPPFFLYA